MRGFEFHTADKFVDFYVFQVVHGFAADAAIAKEHVFDFVAGGVPAQSDGPGGGGDVDEFQSVISAARVAKAGLVAVSRLSDVDVDHARFPLAPFGFDEKVFKANITVVFTR